MARVGAVSKNANNYYNRVGAVNEIFKGLKSIMFCPNGNFRERFSVGFPEVPKQCGYIGGKGFGPS